MAASWTESATEVKESIYQFVRHGALADLLTFYGIDRECRDIVPEDVTGGGFRVAENALERALHEAMARDGSLEQAAAAGARQAVDRRRAVHSLIQSHNWHVRLRDAEPLEAASARNDVNKAVTGLGGLQLLAEALQSLNPVHGRILHDSRKFLLNVVYSLSPLEEQLETRGVREGLDTIRQLDLPVELTLVFDDEQRPGVPSFPTVVSLVHALHGMRLTHIRFVRPPFAAGSNLARAILGDEDGVGGVPLECSVELVIPRFPDLWVSPKLRQAWVHMMRRLRQRTVTPPAPVAPAAKMPFLSRATGRVDVVVQRASPLMNELLLASNPRVEPSIMTESLLWGSGAGRSNAWVTMGWDQRQEHDERAATHWNTLDWAPNEPGGGNVVQFQQFSIVGAYAFIKAVATMLRQQRHEFEYLHLLSLDRLDLRMVQRLVMSVPRACRHLQLVAPGLTIATPWDYHGWPRETVMRVVQTVRDSAPGLETISLGGDTLPIAHAQEAYDALQKA